MKSANSKIPAVRTTKVGHRTLIVRASLFEAVGVTDPTPFDARPVTITPRQARELVNLSRQTIDRMIAAGRAEQAEQASQSTAA
jgi:hypothetical protein